MEQQINPQDIIEKLAKIQAQVNKLQEDFEDSILSREDLEAIKLADKEYKEGKTTSLEELEREFGLD